MMLLLKWIVIGLASLSSALDDIPSPAYDPTLQKCVAGFCLPMDYKRLEAPFKDNYTMVKVETEIMDVLQVQNFV